MSAPALPTGGRPDRETGRGRLGAKVGLLDAVLLLLLIALLGYRNLVLEKRVAEGEARVVATLLSEHRQNALTRDELGSVRTRLEDDLQAASRRVARLEARAEAASHVITTASPSIVFLQGAYGFEEPQTGRPLRHLLGPDGEPAMTPRGLAMTLEGTGPVAERQFTGTAFVATADRWLLTNRHVVFPWESNESTELFANQGLVPVMHRLVGYLPERPNRLRSSSSAPATRPTSPFSRAMTSRPTCRTWSCAPARRGLAKQ